MTTPTKRSCLDLVLAAILALLGLGSISGSLAQVQIDLPVTPEAVRHGWDPNLVDHSPPTPEFQAFSAASNSAGAVVHLWDYEKAINGGEHFPVFRQLIGDCVANGAARALNCRQAVAIGTDRPDLEFRPANRPWIYGVSRTDPEIGAGRLGRSDGSNGEWAKRACELRGVLADDEPGVPAYSAAGAKEWGYKGPPKEFYVKAEPFRLRSSSKVRTYEQLRDAIASGYPVTIASNVGFKMEPLVRDGKSWGVRSGTWAHQMCITGIDDTAKSPFDRKTGAAYICNSWGADAHGPPADDAPPGGFWVDRTTVEKILAADDSWAFADFDGWKVRDLNFHVFGAGPPQAIAHFPAEAVPLVAASEAFVGLPEDYARYLGGGSALASALTLLNAVRCRRRRVTTLAA